MNRIVVACIAAGLLSSAAFAEDAKPGFDNVDMNRDGVITLAEFATLFPNRGTMMFRNVDRDGDGRLTMAEYASVSVSYRMGDQ